MKLLPPSWAVFQQSLDTWRVSREYAQPCQDYLVHGFSPGSFYTAILENNAVRAFASSHPGNNMTQLKCLSGWIQDRAPRISWGNPERVAAWLQMTTEERRQHLEQAKLILTEQQETWAILKDQPESAPQVW